MAKNITYLIGAGASANTIPVVANMQKRIEDVIYYLQKDGTGIKSILGKPIEPYRTVPEKILKEICDEFRWLLKEAGNYHTIDTLAKAYFLTGNPDYERIKNTLILYFILEQFLVIPSDSPSEFTKYPFDKRYSSFFAAIGRKTKSGLGLNDNVRMLSWNYDLQLELSLKTFTSKSIHEIKQDYRIHPNKYSSMESGIAAINNTGFEVIKLNDNAVWDTSDEADNWYTLFDKNSTDNIAEIINYYNNYKDTRYGQNRYLNFSWEALDEEYNGNYAGYKYLLARAEAVAKETNILVVIGYSFPIFNRELDNRLFKKMENLQKVYIQDKYPEAIESTMFNAFKKLQETKEVQKLKSKSSLHANLTEITELQEVPVVPIHLVKSTDQFFIPYELTSEE